MSTVAGQQGPWLLVLTNPGNPSGCVYQKDELDAIAEVCREQNIIVLRFTYFQITQNNSLLFILIVMKYMQDWLTLETMSAWVMCIQRVLFLPQAFQNGQVQEDGGLDMLIFLSSFPPFIMLFSGMSMLFKARICIIAILTKKHTKSIWKSLTFVYSGASHTYSCGPANIQHAIARAMREDKKELEEYIIMARNCLSAVSEYCHRKESFTQN